VAKIELIDPASIAGRMPRGHLLEEATENLKCALKAAKALKIVLAPEERAYAHIQTYRKAAARLGIGLSVRAGGSRTYLNRVGTQREEPVELYIWVTKAAAKPNPPAAGPRTVDTVTRPPITIPAAKFEKTVLPGVEVSR